MDVMELHDAALRVVADAEIPAEGTGYSSLPTGSDR
jgi:hypothetical protein